MYRALIVDDDEIEREGIISCGILEELEIECVAQAWNGQLALEKFEEFKPDIVISDIRMPIMDGLTLAKRIREKNNNAKIILMSGYEDFAAAKQAVHIGAECYLLKPLDLKELKNVLERLLQDVVKRRDIEKTNQDMKKAVESFQPIVQERLLRDILLGVENASDINTRNKIDKMSFMKGEMKFAVLSVKKSGTFGGNNNFIKVIEKLKQKKEYQEEMGFVIIQNDLVAIVVSIPKILNDKMSFLFLDELSKSLFSKLKNDLDDDITIAISNIGEKKEQLKVLYDQTINALQKRIVYEKNRIYWYEDTHKVSHPLPNIAIVVTNLEKWLLTRDKEQLHLVINEFFKSLSESNVTMDTIHAICIELISRYTVVANENGRDFLNIFENRQVPYKTIIDFKDVKGVREFMESTFQEALEQLYSKHITQTEKITKQAKQIIENNYMEDLSTDSIAAKIYVTPAHLRRVFKNFTGQTVHDYILYKRMFHARELLFDKNLKISDVASRVGYKNDSYFCIAFKKYYGTSPGVYRDET